MKKITFHSESFVRELILPDDAVIDNVELSRASPTYYNVIWHSSEDLDHNVFRSGR